MTAPTSDRRFRSRPPAGLRATLWAVLALFPGEATVSAQATETSDEAAVRIAETVLERLGGRDAWETTRYLRWRFSGRRLHHWDRFTGDVRIEDENRLVLMNLGTREGRVWDDGVEITDPPALAEALARGYGWWVNDSYWLIMPFKLLDPGVTLRSAGESILPDGRAADRLTLTFAPGTGLTPQNKYEIWVARDTGLVEQWSYFPDVADLEPKFTGPWGGWKRFGGILLATRHGRGLDWEIDVPSKLPPSVFRQP